MKNVYVKTKKEGEIVRTSTYTNGGVCVCVDFNYKREVVGVEIIDAESIKINGEEVTAIVKGI